MRKIFALLLVIGLTLAVVAEEKVVETSYPPKEEEPKLNGWGNKFFEALDNEVEDTKSYQKKQWEKMKKQFKNLFNNDDKEWEKIDKEREGGNE
jgi:hypothetical protein